MTIEYEFSIKIGLTEAGLVNIESLNGGDFPPPKSVFLDYPRKDTLADLSKRGMGLPTIRMDWGVVTQAQRDTLVVYCPNLVSNPVFVEVPDNNGVYRRFTTTLYWPDEGNLEKFRDKILGFFLEFAGSEDITPIPAP